MLAAHSWENRPLDLDADDDLWGWGGECSDPEAVEGEDNVDVEVDDNVDIDI